MQLVKAEAEKVAVERATAEKEVPVERAQVVMVHREVTSKPRSVSCAAQRITCAAHQSQPDANRTLTADDPRIINALSAMRDFLSFAKCCTFGG